MPQALKLGNQPYAVFAANGCEFSRALRGDRRSPLAQLRMGLELEMVIDFQDDHVEAKFSELGDLIAERFQVFVGVVAKQMQRSPLAGFRPRLRLAGICRCS